LTELINTMTEWLPWPWAQHTAELLIYMGLLAALSVAPLIAWFLYVAVMPTRKRA
jgi:hypothetical protein